MQSFVDDLLDIRQIKDGVFSLEYSTFDLNEVLEEICEIFRPQTFAKGVELIVEICSKKLRLPNV